MTSTRNSIFLALGMGLLAGLLAALGLVLLSSSATMAQKATSPDLLPGVDLVTEEVEPGVYRVLDDGAGHDLVAEPPVGVAVGADDSVWLLRSGPRKYTDALFELGREGTFPLEASGVETLSTARSVSP